MSRAGSERRDRYVIRGRALSSVARLLRKNIELVARERRDDNVVSLPKMGGMMRHAILVHTLIALTTFSYTAARAAAEESGGGGANAGNERKFKLTGRLIVAGEVVETTICFDGDHAVSFVADRADAIFQLREPAWQDLGSGKRMTLDESKRWHAESRQKSEKSLADVKDEALRRFVMPLMQPDFELGEIENGFVMKNSSLEYVIQPVGQLSAVRNEMVATYNRLAAYQTAIITRKLPPDPALAVAAELEKRGVYPKQMKFVLTTPKAKQEMTFDLALQPLTKEDGEAVAEALKGVAGKSIEPATKR